MPALSEHAVPSYRRHKQSGQAIVTLSGRDFLLGSYRSAESRAKYNRLVSEWLAHGRRWPGEPGSDLSINELILAFWTHAKAYYRKEGAPTSELELIRLAHRPLKDLYGATRAADFGPLALKAVRQKLIEGGLSRKVINKQVDRIRRMFKWGTGNELLPAHAYHGLAAVEGLKKGRCDVREGPGVRPVDDAAVDAVIRALSPSLSALIELRAQADRGVPGPTDPQLEARIARLAQLVPLESPVAAMIQLQRLSGARPGEIVRMRTGDLDTGGAIWVYRPARHKTEHFDHARPVGLGPRAQEILRPFLRPDPAAPLFSPRASVAAHRRRRRAARRSRVQPSQRDRRSAAPARQPGERYDVNAYRRAIGHACKRAGVPPWHPNQLRHNAATNIRKLYGLDHARAVLGHTSVEVTQVYAELDGKKAEQVMAQVG